MTGPRARCSQWDALLLSQNGCGRYPPAASRNVSVSSFELNTARSMSIGEKFWHCQADHRFPISKTKGRGKGMRCSRPSLLQPTCVCHRMPLRAPCIRRLLRSRRGRLGRRLREAAPTRNPRGLDAIEAKAEASRDARGEDAMAGEANPPGRARARAPRSRHPPAVSASAQVSGALCKQSVPRSAAGKQQRSIAARELANSLDPCDHAGELLKRLEALRAASSRATSRMSAAAPLDARPSSGATASPVPTATFSKRAHGGVQEPKVFRKART